MSRFTKYRNTGSRIACCPVTGGDTHCLMPAYWRRYRQKHRLLPAYGRRYISCALSTFHPLLCTPNGFLDAIAFLVRNALLKLSRFVNAQCSLTNTLGQLMERPHKVAEFFLCQLQRFFRVNQFLLKHNLHLVLAVVNAHPEIGLGGEPCCHTACTQRNAGSTNYSTSHTSSLSSSVVRGCRPHLDDPEPRSVPEWLWLNNKSRSQPCLFMIIVPQTRSKRMIN